MTVKETKDYLWLNIRELPYFRGLLRAIEGRFYEDIELVEPVLDLGCGDGQFAAVTFNKKINFGIDPWTGPIKQAIKQKSYQLVVQGSGARLPVPAKSYATVISNSVLEHIEDLDPVLAEVSRVIKPGGKFVFCVPNQYFLENLSVSNFFDSIGLRFLGNAYRKFFNKISRHYHCDDPQTWQKRLEDNGFELVRWWHYFSPAAFHVLEWGHYFGLPTVISKFLTGKWIMAPYRWNFILTNKFLQKYYQEDPEHEKGSYTFYVARKKQD